MVTDLTSLWWLFVVFLRCRLRRKVDRRFRSSICRLCAWTRTRRDRRHKTRPKASPMRIWRPVQGMKTQCRCDRFYQSIWNWENNDNPYVVCWHKPTKAKRKRALCSSRHQYSVMQSEYRQISESRAYGPVKAKKRCKNHPYKSKKVWQANRNQHSH